MEMNSNTDAMRALSRLYRIEAERMESSESPEIAVLKAQLRAVQSSRQALDQKIRDTAQRAPSRSGISHESAWKILTVTFAITGLFGFLAALFFTGANNPAPAVSPEPLHTPTFNRTPAPPTEPVHSAEADPNTGEAISAKPGRPSPIPSGKHSGAGNNSKRERGGKQTTTTTKKPPKKDDFEFFDKCGMDPMCGFDKKSK